MGYIKDRDIHSSGLSVASIRGGYNANPWSRILYVSSTHSRASDTSRTGEDYTHPLATISQALSMIATKGWTDAMVLVAPGHVETISAATAISQAGTTVIGLGEGARRPQITFDTVVGAAFTVSGSGVLLENLEFLSGIDALTTMVIVTAANCTIRNCKITDDATYQAGLGITFAAASSNCVVEGLVANQRTAGATACIRMTGPSDGLVIKDCQIVGDYSVACISNNSIATTNQIIQNNYLENLNAVDVCIDLVGTSDPAILDNRMRIATDIQTTWVDTHDGSMAENYGVNDDGETGKLIGTASV